MAIKLSLALLLVGAAVAATAAGPKLVQRLEKGEYLSDANLLDDVTTYLAACAGERAQVARRPNERKPAQLIDRLDRGFAHLRTLRAIRQLFEKIEKRYTVDDDGYYRTVLAKGRALNEIAALRAKAPASDAARAEDKARLMTLEAEVPRLETDLLERRMATGSRVDEVPDDIARVLALRPALDSLRGEWVTTIRELQQTR